MSVESSKHQHTQHDNHRVVDRAKQDDLLWTTKQALQSSVMPAPKSAVGTLLDTRFAMLFSALREEGRAGGQKGGQEEGITGRLDESPLFGASVDDLPRLQGRAEAPASLQLVGVDPLLSLTTADGPQLVSSEEVPQFVGAPEQHSSQQTNQEVLRAPQAVTPSWVWIASQALGANLKRLGFEPSELDDIRVSLIRVLAAEFPKLKLLNRLPSSLIPSAPEKVVDDIRVMALAYTMNELLAKSVKDMEEGEPTEESVKQVFEIPRSVSNRYKDIPEILYDPTDSTVDV